MIRRMETELKEIKQNVVSSMERKIDELKASLLVLFEQSAKKEKSFSAVLQEVSHGSRDVDEGFCNDTASSHVLGTSQTHPKTLFQKENLTETVHVNPNDVTQPDAMQPKTTPMQPEARHKTPVQQVPVRITTRDTTRQTQSSRPVTSQRQTDKTLLIGDSLLNPVNTKGLIRGTHKHARSGATISDITNDISFYDVKAFSNIIISVGGNDASQKTEEELFEEKYDQLISLIKTSSPKTTVYICKIVPRGDVDVSSLNTCIERLGLHWQKHDVICISKTSDYFCGKNRVPTERYYSTDKIHLSRSGVKRLLDAINSTVKIVDKYEMCVFSKPGNQRNTGNYHIRTNSGQEQRRGRQGSRYGERRHVNKRCYACRMMGHISSECWNWGLGITARTEKGTPLLSSNSYDILNDLCNQCNSLNCACNYDSCIIHNSTTSFTSEDSKIINEQSSGHCVKATRRKHTLNSSFVGQQVINNNISSNVNDQLQSVNDIISSHSSNSDFLNFELTAKGLNFAHLNVQGLCGQNMSKFSQLKTMLKGHI